MSKIEDNNGQCTKTETDGVNARSTTFELVDLKQGVCCL